jgi:hypothetical protein
LLLQGPAIKPASGTGGNCRIGKHNGAKK